MDYAALSVELTTDPLGLGYAGMTDAEAAAALNDPAGPGSAEVLVPNTIIRSNEIYAALGDPTAAGAVMKKLRQSATDYHKDFAAMLEPASVSGVDIGHPLAQAWADLAVGSGILSQPEADAIKALGKAPKSRAEVLGFGSIRPGDVEFARRV